MNISLVIPVFNEEDNLQILTKEIDDIIKQITDVYEIIYVDDGSTDNSYNLMLELKKIYPKIRILKFKYNCGQSAAFAAGFKNALYDIIITLDADLQNDPKDIPDMLKKIDEGYDAVIGWRKHRNDSIIKLLSSKIANTIRNTLNNETIPDTGCSLKIYKTKFIKNIKIFKGMHRFLPTLLKLEGAKIAVVEVNHRNRKFGETKYGVLNRLIQPFLDCLAVRWMQKRYINYKLEIDTNIEPVPFQINQ